MEILAQFSNEQSSTNFYERKHFNVIGFKIADPTKFILAPVSNSLMVFHWSTTDFSIDNGIFGNLPTLLILSSLPLY
jgi:hypothetical protein